MSSSAVRGGVPSLCPWRSSERVAPVNRRCCRQARELATRRRRGGRKSIHTADPVLYHGKRRTLLLRPSERRCRLHVAREISRQMVKAEDTEQIQFSSPLRLLSSFQPAEEGWLNIPEPSLVRHVLGGGPSFRLVGRVCQTVLATALLPCSAIASFLRRIQEYSCGHRFRS